VPEPSSEINPLDRLAEEFVARCRKGERPPLSEYIARHPELAEEIRDLFPGLVLMEGIRPEAGEATGAIGVASGEGKRPERLGDFRILREVGRGGMGIVYEAEQESLGRHVALKVLPSHALLDAKYLQRFQREARAAAKLHHTNIVPVYGVGHDDGLHYYVMQFIQGLALDEVLDELKKLRRVRQEPTTTAEQPSRIKQSARVSDVSAVDVAQALLTGDFSQARSASEEPPSLALRACVKSSPSDSAVHLPGSSSQSSLSDSGRQYWQSVARIGIQVAEALAYAHGQGTLHRDIKPSNLLLDTRGTVWIADFGLAKEVDSGDLTHTGDLVGTLRYMAPERFAGQSDPRSDLYGLGLTLYELLTLRPAFERADRNQLIALVQHEEPPRPRKLQPDVPRDLETIVLKAIAKEPDHRYATAAELAEDLKRFVEDKPIQARRVSQVERLWRWCRRNPVVAALTAAVALLLVTTTAVAFAFALHQQQAKQDLADALDTAERNHREAELHAASLAVDIDLQHCEHGEIENGILGLARTLKTVRPDATELHQLIEMNLLAWSQELRPLGPTFQYDGSETQWALSPDGLTVLTGGADGTVRLWDAFTGEVRSTMRSDQGKITYVTFSENGQVAMTMRDYLTIQLWDTAAGRARAVIANQRKGFEKIFLSPDGKRLLTYYSDPPGYDPTNMTIRTVVTLWDTATGQRIKDLTGHAGRVNAAVFCPDGKMVLTGGADKTARLWSSDSGVPLATLQGSLGAITTVAFSPEGDVAATLEYVLDEKQQVTGGKVRWWDVHRTVQNGPACFSKQTWGEFRCIHPEVAVIGSWDGMGATLPISILVRGTEHAIEIETHAPTCKADNDYLLASEGRLLDLRSGKRHAVPPGRRFSDDLARFASDGRFFVSVSGKYGGMGVQTERSLIDLRTERAIGKTNAWVGDLRHVPDRKTFVALSWPSPRYIPTTDGSLDAEVAQLFAEVVTCQELDPAGSIRPLEEAEWEERRGKLVERLREHPAPFPVGRAAADPWLWLRRKLDSAKTDEEKLKYLDRLIAVEPTWKNYEQRAQVHYYRFYPWDDSKVRRKVPDEAASRKFAAEAARDFLEAGKRAGSGYWHQVRYDTEYGPRSWPFRLAAELARPNHVTPDQYDLGLQLAEALHPANPDDRYRRQVLAKALYRVGRYAEALPLLPQREWERHCITQMGRLLMSPWTVAIRKEAFLNRDTELNQDNDRLMEAMAYLAMTYHRLGHPDQARAVLAHLRTWYLKSRGNLGPDMQSIADRYPDLLREAEALIEGQPRTP
jgi:serine/threonine protein kinase/WD40 repeat protein